MKVQFRFPVILVVLALAALALSQGEGNVQVGRLWTGAKGITVSVADIMKRPKSIPWPPQETKQDEMDTVLRQDLPLNPLSPRIGQYPPAGSARGLFKGGGAGPLFSIGNSWDGGNLGQSGLIPPDSEGATSPTQVLMCANGVIKVYDKAGNIGGLNTTTGAFWASVSGGSTPSDPRVRFDRLTNRWIIVEINTTQPNRVMIAVSSGPVITSQSSFTFYQFLQSQVTPVGDTSALFDYPSLGVDANALYIGGNMFTSGYTGSAVFVVNKASVMSGGPIVATVFRNIGTNGATGVYTPQGVDNDDPSPAFGYVIGSDTNAWGDLVLRRISNAGGTPSISGNIVVTVPATYMPNGASVPALGSTGRLAAIDDRLYGAMLRLNRLTGTRTLWTAHSEFVDSTGASTSGGTRYGARWYQLANVDTTPTLVQAGTFFDSSASAESRWFGSIAMNGQGHAFIGSSAAGTTRRAEIAGAYRLGTDPLGTLQPGQTLRSTTFNYNVQSGTQRWGDYSHTVVDPADDMTMWTFQEYCDATNSWAERVTQIMAPAPTVTNISPGSGNLSSTLDVSVNGSGIFDPGPGFPNRLGATVSGTGVTVNSVTFVSASQATVNLTIASTAATGARTLTLVNPDGQTATATFTVTSSATGTGTVTLGDWTASPAGQQVTFQIKDAANNVLQTATATLDSSGGYSFVPTVAPGTYTVTAKGTHWLRKAITGVTVTSAGFSGVNFTLLNGDVNGDNSVTLADFTELRNAFGTSAGDPNWNPNADLNGDGAVTLADFAILRAHFGQVGD